MIDPYLHHLNPCDFVKAPSACLSIWRGFLWFAGRCCKSQTIQSQESHSDSYKQRPVDCLFQIDQEGSVISSTKILGISFQPLEPLNKGHFGHFLKIQWVFQKSEIFKVTQCHQNGTNHLHQWPSQSHQFTAKRWRIALNANACRTSIAGPLLSCLASCNNLPMWKGFKLVQIDANNAFTEVSFLHACFTEPPIMPKNRRSTRAFEDIGPLKANLSSTMALTLADIPQNTWNLTPSHLKIAHGISVSPALCTWATVCKLMCNFRFGLNPTYYFLTNTASSLQLLLATSKSYNSLNWRHLIGTQVTSGGKKPWHKAQLSYTPRNVFFSVSFIEASAHVGHVLLPMQRWQWQDFTLQRYSQLNRLPNWKENPNKHLSQCEKIIWKIWSWFISL